MHLKGAFTVLLLELSENENQHHTFDDHPLVKQIRWLQNKIENPDTQLSDFSQY